MKKNKLYILIILLSLTSNSWSQQTILDTSSSELVSIEDTKDTEASLITDSCNKIDIVISEVKRINEKLNQKDEEDYSYLIPIIVVLIAGLLALFQVKANIISTARIEWTQNLRKYVSSFLSEIMILNYNLRRVLELSNQKKTTDAQNLYDNQTENFKKIYEYGNLIKLFLNNQEENAHIELQELIGNYLGKSTHGRTSQELDNLDELQKTIIEKSQIILKQTWEDAKTFKVRDVFKFGW